MTEKELEIQRSLVTDYEGEIELLSEERNTLSEQKHCFMLVIKDYYGAALGMAEKDEKIHQLRDKCEELEQLGDVEMKLQKAEEEIKR